MSVESETEELRLTGRSMEMKYKAINTMHVHANEDMSGNLVYYMLSVILCFNGNDRVREIIRGTRLLIDIRSKEIYDTVSGDCALTCVPRIICNSDVIPWKLLINGNKNLHFLVQCARKILNGLKLKRVRVRAGTLNRKAIFDFILIIFYKKNANAGCRGRRQALTLSPRTAKFPLRPNCGYCDATRGWIQPGQCDWAYSAPAQATEGEGRYERWCSRERMRDRGARGATGNTEPVGPAAPPAILSGSVAKCLFDLDEVLCTLSV
ncbi:hypothetical protein EVAR_78700_1 [Eumeta japonica]|uniref:Uncharacterized protein n=1 Tax=Eumeta variegata TaxID=151549 RepID=A0A4C1T225_EUMVA|nr:hypothetical protein EVAR_78700_1 [Eumeta japonica]